MTSAAGSIGIAQPKVPVGSDRGFIMVKQFWSCIGGHVVGVLHPAMA